MKDIINAIGDRIKSPYFGYSVFAFIALNWRALFILFLSKTSPQNRLLAFDEVTSFWTLFVIPLLVGFLVAVVSPWIGWIFEYISRTPFQLTDNLRIEAQHKNTIKQAELEQSRTDLFAIKEKELIARAKRDEEVAEITDEEAKDKLSIELNQLREERDELSHQLQNSNENLKSPLNSLTNLSDPAIEILLAAAKDKNGTIMISKTMGGRSIISGGITFGKEDQRSFVKYEEGIELLVDYSLIKERGLKGEVFELTNKGWEAANAL